MADLSSKQITHYDIPTVLRGEHKQPCACVECRAADEIDRQRAQIARLEELHALYQDKVQRQRAEIERIREVFGMSEPWPLNDILAKLVEATQHLLDDHNCDTHGHEEFRHAASGGKACLSRIQSALRRDDSPVETSAWQSIETAPKDGRTVLVKSGNWVVTAHWHPSQCWATCGPSYEPIPSDEQPEKWAPIPEGGPSENGLGD